MLKQSKKKATEFHTHPNMAAAMDVLVSKFYISKWNYLLKSWLYKQKFRDETHGIHNKQANVCKFFFHAIPK